MLKRTPNKVSRIMIGTMTPPEAIAILSLLMASADDEITMDEITTMLSNPFFTEHVSDKIGDHKAFLHQFLKLKQTLGKQKLEEQAIKVIKNGFPALQLKTVALLTLIADADGIFDQKEKELIARVATTLNIKAEEVDPELQKMRKKIERQAAEAVQAKQQATEPTSTKEAVDK